MKIGMFAKLSKRWACRICCRVALCLFAAILAVELVIIVPAYHRYQAHEVQKIERIGLGMILTLLASAHGDVASKQFMALAGDVTQASVLEGIQIFNEKDELLVSEGVKPFLSLQAAVSLKKASARLNEDYDLISVYDQTQLHSPYRVLVQLDARDVPTELLGYIQRMTGFILFIVIVMTMVTVFVINRSVLLPLFTLSDVMKAAKADPDHPAKHRMHVRRFDEIGDLYAHYNAMLETIEAHIQSGHRHAEELEEKVQARTRELVLTNVKLKEAALEHESVALFSMENPSPVLRVSTEGCLTYANRSSTALLAQWGVEKGDHLPDSWLQVVEDVVREAEARHVDVEVGEKVLSLSLIPLVGRGYVNIYGSDITERVIAENAMRTMKNYDDVTGLPTRVLFDNLLEELHHLKPNDPIAVVTIGASRFDEIMNALGRRGISSLMKSISKRLACAVPKQAVLATLSLNTFSFAVSEKKQIDCIDSIVSEVLAHVQGHYPADPVDVDVSLNAGITFYRGGRFSAARLLEQGNHALFHARSASVPYQHYAEKLDIKLKKRQKQMLDLRNGIADHQFELVYQPQHNTGTKSIVGAEALVRWHHPEEGLIMPNDFIPLAEEGGCIVQLGEWILKTACMQCMSWYERTGIECRVAVNVSTIQFRAKGFIELVKTALEQTNLPPHFLELEVTERTFIGNVEEAIEIMQSLRTLGVFLSIDDFGTGYSSLNYLKRFPISKLKIDKSFVDDLAVGEEGCEIVSAIIQLGHSLHLKVIAEGVETKGQFELLRQEGCDEIQGYYFHQPVSFDAFLSLLAQ